MFLRAKPGVDPSRGFSVSVGRTRPCVCQLTGRAPYPGLPPRKINVVPNDQSLRVPVAAYTRSKRATQVIPLLIALGMRQGWALE